MTVKKLFLKDPKAFAEVDIRGSGTTVSAATLRILEEIFDAILCLLRGVYIIRLDYAS